MEMCKTNSLKASYLLKKERKKQQQQTMPTGQLLSTACVFQSNAAC